MKTAGLALVAAMVAVAAMGADWDEFKVKREAVFEFDQNVRRQRE